MKIYIATEVHYRHKDGTFTISNFPFSSDLNREKHISNWVEFFTGLHYKYERVGTELAFSEKNGEDMHLIKTKEVYLDKVLEKVNFHDPSRDDCYI